MNAHVPPPEPDPLEHLDGDEGAHRPFPDPEHSIAPRKPRTVGGAIYLAVLATTAAGLAVVALDRWRAGLGLMGVALFVGAVGRLVLADERAGMLRLRRKLFDVLTLLVLGGGLVALSLAIPDRPL